MISMKNKYHNGVKLSNEFYYRNNLFLPSLLRPEDVKALKLKNIMLSFLIRNIKR